MNGTACQWCGVSRAVRSRLRLCFSPSVFCRLCRDCHRSRHARRIVEPWPRWYRAGEAEPRGWFNKSIPGGFN